jgi:hypothetical protein
VLHDAELVEQRLAASRDAQAGGVEAVANYGSDGSGSTVSVLLGTGTGSFNPQTVFTVGSAPDAVVVADFNGDGLPDLAVGNFYDGTVSILLDQCSP